MGDTWSSAEHRKRKRRRPLSAWLKASDEGNEAFVPHQFYSELYRQHLSKEPSYLGIAPWCPSQSESVEDSIWTIVPVRPGQAQESEGLRPDTIHLPRTLSAWLTLLPRLENSLFGQQDKRTDGYEVRVVEVHPLELGKIFISIDGEALKKHEEVQSRFGGGFVTKGKGKNPVQPATKGDTFDSNAIDDELISAVRQALSTAVIARQGDTLLLPLPAHPITHVPFPPAQIVLCEPVAQGLPTSHTKIVVSRINQIGSVRSPMNDSPLPILSSSKSLTDFDITDGDATSNEAYHSALEDGDTSDEQRDAGTRLDRLNGDAKSQFEDSEDDSESSSDDSSEGMISMSTPALAAKRPSMMSSRATATPRGYAAKANGVSTPGSLISNMTSMTAKRDYLNRGRLFRAHVLQCKVPNELLHPSPAYDDDNECRVFVDLKTLVRLGCFSGDWVKVANSKLQDHSVQMFNVRSVDWDHGYRPAKIYGLPDVQSNVAPRSSGGMRRSRRASLLPLSDAVSGALNSWLPPILFANLGRPESVRISGLREATSERPLSRSWNGPRKVDSSVVPPTALEMTLLRVATPLSTEISVQNGLFSSLKRYFEKRRRLVRKDDLIAIPLDAKTSRLFAQSGQESDFEDELEELLALSDDDHGSIGLASDLAWFKVGSIVGPEPLEASDLGSDIWNGVASIEPEETRMRQAGSAQCKVPPHKGGLLQYYCGSSQIGDNFSIRAPTASSLKPYIPALQRRLRELMAAAISPRALHLRMDPVIVLLHSSQRSIGKASLATRAADDLGLHTFTIDSYDLLSEGTGGGDVKAEAFLKARVDRALACGAAFTSLLIRHIEALTADRMVAAMRDILKDVRVLIATTTELDQVPEGIRSLFTHEIELAAPDEGEREGLLRDVIQAQRLNIASDVDLASIATKTAALVAGNLVDIVERAKVARRVRLEQLTSTPHSDGKTSKALTVRDVLVSGGEAARCITRGDFDVAVEAARKNFADSIGAPKIPNVSWDDVGGLEHVKDAVLETIQLPLERPELFAKGMKKRSGILFYGPPGTGKTLLAKAIATEFSLNFFSVKGPELLNMYIGESEANVRRVFQRARDARPCVVFFDELDSVAPKRGNQGDSGGVMDRIVSQLLAELDGMSDGEEGAGGVFVIGATNRPDLLDQALLRPGRFDKMLYLGVSDTHDKQLTILEALTRKFTMQPDLSLRRVADVLPFTYTGADLYALCSDAMLKAITRQASSVDAKIRALPGGPVTTAYFFDHLAKEEDIAVMVTGQDFAGAQRELVPSVSAKELDHYKRVRREFEGEPKPSHLNGLAPNSKPTSNGQPVPPAPSRRLKSSKQRDQVSRNSSESMNKTRSKGKATKWDSDDEDEAYVTSNDYSTPERKKSNSNGNFGSVGQGDDEELYG